MQHAALYLDEGFVGHASDDIITERLRVVDRSVRVNVALVLVTEAVHADALALATRGIDGALLVERRLGNVLQIPQVSCSSACAHASCVHVHIHGAHPRVSLRMRTRARTRAYVHVRARAREEIQVRVRARANVCTSARACARTTTCTCCYP